MKRLQTSGAAKFTAVLLLLALTFLGSVFGLKALLAAEYWDADSYEETIQFYQLLDRYQDKLASVYAEEYALANYELSYAERRQAEAELEKLRESLKPENTNFRFRVYDKDGTELKTNIRPDDMLGELRYATFTLGEHTMTVEYNGSRYGQSLYPESTDTSDTAAPDDPPIAYTAACGVVEDRQLTKGEAQDEFYHLYYAYSQGNTNFPTWLALCGGLLAGAVLCLLYLLWAAGHKAGTEEIVLTWQEHIFFEVYLAVLGLVVCLPVMLGFYMGDYLVSEYYHYGPDPWQSDARWLIPAIAAMAAVAMGLVTLVLRTLAVRLKARVLARTTLFCRAVGWCWRLLGRGWSFCLDLLHGLPLFWKAAVGYVIFFFANVMLFTQAIYNGFWGLMWLLLNGAVFVGLCWWSLSFHRLRSGSRAIAAGDLDHHLDTAKMPHDLKAHGEDLNNLSSGLAAAVDQQMKSERFKAELITNVSHDLKTPLTSIISYVDLLKTTEQTDPKAVEYIEVLDRKSQRLKKLTEDLVEASKASTGVLTVSREKIGMAQLLDQAMGEWTEKLEARKLTVVTTVPEGETWVYADGRHLWRVIDNLLSNCAKYAMEGTRVYLDLNRGKGQIALSVKNISREPLNVPPEQLMERFVRGEESRTTEGSGLGLSIARSLTELQGGTFDLTVDGDLFKAVVTLPQAN